METVMSDTPKLVRFSATKPAPAAMRSVADVLAALRRVTWDSTDRFFCRIQDCDDTWPGGAITLAEHELRMVLILPLCRRHARAVGDIARAAERRDETVPYRFFGSARIAKEFLDEGPHVIKQRPVGGDFTKKPVESVGYVPPPGGAYGSVKFFPITGRAPVRPDCTQSLRAREVNARRVTMMRERYASPDYLERLADAPRRPGHVQGLAAIVEANRLVDAAAAAKAKGKNQKKGGDKKRDKKK